MDILIVEDDQDISRSYEVILKSRGHRVTITSDGPACIDAYNNKIKLLKETSSKSKNFRSHIVFDVVVIDYAIPFLNGLEVAKRILELNPNQRIIFASAYVKQTLEESVKELKTVVETLQKPFEPEDLADLIEDKEVYQNLGSLISNIRGFNTKNPSKAQMTLLFESLRKIQKNRSF